MSKKNEIYNLINSTNIYNNNFNNNTTSILKEILIPNNNITSSSTISSSSYNNEQSVTIVNSFKSFIESIPQSLLLMCVLVLFILFFILIIIILICLIKKRKRLLQTETIVNNNKIDINKMILKNSNNSKPNKNDFHAIQNNSNLSDYSGGVQNMSLSEIKAKNLKEEIHSIVSGTLNEMTINKGKIDGIVDNQIVVTKDGMIGEVIDSSLKTSKIRLVTSFTSPISITINDVTKLLTVDNYKLYIRRINKKDNIKIGDKVLTSGLQEKYPKGILIGEVKEIYNENDNVGLIAKVDYSANLNNIYFVTILKRKEK